MLKQLIVSISNLLLYITGQSKNGKFCDQCGNFIAEGRGDMGAYWGQHAQNCGHRALARYVRALDCENGIGPKLDF